MALSLLFPFGGYIFAVAVMNPTPDTAEPAIYVIGGLPRTGKTSLCTRLGQTLGVNYFETDHLRAMFDADPASRLGYSAGTKIKTVTRLLRPYLEQLIDCHAMNGLSWAVNGEAIQPAMVGTSPHAAMIRSCFLGLSDPEQSFANIREHATERDWTRNLPDDQLRNILDKYARRSGKLSAQCAEWNLPYFDVTNDFTGAHAQAYIALTQPGGTARHPDTLELAV
jgi:hypothetical protein